MELLINIEELVYGNTIECERLKFKQGWSPVDIVHSTSVFANNLHNWGVGYIILNGAYNRATNGVNQLIFSDILKIIGYGNRASNEAGRPQ